MDKPAPLVRTGLFGGSFDPIHTGHLVIAHDAQEALGLEEIFFIPTGKAPMKPSEHTADPFQRKDMVEKAIGKEPSFRLIDFEILKPGETSYTIHTVRHIHAKFPGRQFFWILGADQFEKLPHWREIEDLCNLMEFAVLSRPGNELNPPDIPNLKYHPIQGHPIDISSTEIRKRAATNQPFGHFLPGGVHEYISHNNTYEN
jgi:nicotinate-nucleotide adenylyltransferase